jgi:hypothetical protein
MFAIAFGLSMDYEVFLLTRRPRGRRKTAGVRELDGRVRYGVRLLVAGAAPVPAGSPLLRVARRARLPYPVGIDPESDKVGWPRGEIPLGHPTKRQCHLGACEPAPLDDLQSEYGRDRRASGEG